MLAKHLGIAGLCLAIANLAAADDQADAHSIITKAIKAAGGEQNLKKFNAQTWKEVGTYYGMGEGLPYVGSYAAAYPKKFKMEIQGVFQIVVNGDKGWVQSGGEVREMTEEELKNHQGEMYAGWVASLLPLQDNKKFKLATTGETKVKDRTAVGVRVSSDGHKDVNLYFDKDKFMLIKIEHRANASEQGNKEVTAETYLSDYKEVDGAKIPFKFVMTRDGEKYVEAETTEVQGVEQLDDSMFAKP